MPTTWLSFVFGFILSLVGAFVPFGIDMLSLTSLPAGSAIDGFHAFTLPMAEILFVGVTLTITASVCVLDGLFGENDPRQILGRGVHALLVLGIVAAIALIILYDHLLSAPTGSEFASFMSHHEIALFLFVVAICALSGLIQFLIVKNYLRITEVG